MSARYLTLLARPNDARSRSARHHRVAPRRRRGRAQSRQAAVRELFRQRRPGARSADGGATLDRRRDRAPGARRGAVRRRRRRFSRRARASCASARYVMTCVQVCASASSSFARINCCSVRSPAARAASSRRARRTRWRRSRSTGSCAASGSRSAASRAAIRSLGRASIPCRRAPAGADETAVAIHGKARLSRDLSLVRGPRGLPGVLRAEAGAATGRPRPAPAPTRRRQRTTTAAGVTGAGGRAGAAAPSTRRADRRRHGARDIVVETDTVRAVFSTAGATLKSWQLKKYLDDAGQPLELVPAGRAATLRGRSRSRPTTPALSQTLATALFSRAPKGCRSASAPGTLTFQYQRRVRPERARRRSTSSPTASRTSSTSKPRSTSAARRSR